MALKAAGGLWLKDGAKGKFFSGEFEPEGKGGPKYRVMIFKNTEKEGKQPDYRIMLVDDEGEEPRKRQKPADSDLPF
jgi:hypothetical protein